MEANEIQLLTKMTDEKNYSLKQHNTFGIDARCERYIEFDSVEELHRILPSIDQSKPVMVLGSGSNLLLTRDFIGTVISPNPRFEARVSFDGDTPLLRCWAGSNFDRMVAYCVQYGWHGAENLSLIPGEVGASAVQNIGAYGAEAKDIIHKVEAVELATGKDVSFTNADCQYAYRSSRFKHEWKGKYIITYVTYKLSAEFEPKLDYGNLRKTLEEKGITDPSAEDVRNTVIEIRRQKLPDPDEIGNAGSFFMNPIVPQEKADELLKIYPNMPHYTMGPGQVKIPAGWMIEQCGWKGKSLGRAGVYEKQALVLVNRGEATAQEVVDLMHAVEHDVKEKFGIDIHPEVNVI